MIARVNMADGGGEELPEDSEFSRKLVSHNADHFSTHSRLWLIQVATLKWVKKHTNIPVPVAEVYAYDETVCIC
jgi:hypothetical protein